MPEQLNAYETRLLDQLQTQLAGLPEPAPRRPARRRAITAARASIAVAIAAAGGVTVLHLTAEPAWAVAPHADGTVTVTVNHIDDPGSAGKLQQRLHDLGIQADVQFPPEGQQCADDRITKANELPDTQPDGIQKATMGHKVSITIDRGAMPKNTTIILEVATLDHISDHESMGIVGRLGVVRGPAPACHLVPLTSSDFNPHPSATPSR